jgi:hypothetical protein
MTSVGVRRGLARQVVLPDEGASVARSVLLGAGICYSVLYVAADIFGSVLWEGYSYTSQAMSELVAIGSPVRATVGSLFILVGALLVAFVIGVWRFSAGKAALRITAGLLGGVALIGFAWSFFPIHLRGAERTLTDTVHNAFAAVIVLLILTAIGFSSKAFGRRFRIYSIATIVTLIAFGLLSVLYVPRVEAQLPTPGFGIAERINVYGYALWVAVLAITMLRARETSPPH